MTVVVEIKPPDGARFDTLGVLWRDVAMAAGVPIFYVGEDAPSFIAPGIVSFYEAHAFVFARTGKSLTLDGHAAAHVAGFALAPTPPPQQQQAFTAWPRLIKGWRAFYADGRETWDWQALRRRCTGVKLPDPVYYNGAAFMRETDRRDGFAALLNASRSQTRALSREIVAIIREVQSDPITMETPA